MVYIEASLNPLEKSLAEPPKPSLSGIIENTKSWSQFYGDGFAIRVPPQFEDITEPEDYNAGLSLYGDKAKPKTFAARFASSDGYEHTKNSHFALTYEVVSVVIKPSNQLKLTFLEAKDISDFGSLREAAKIFVPGGATIYSARTIKIKEEEGFKTYYFYEFGRGKQHVALVAAVNGGRAYIAGATAPDFKWNDDGVKLRSAAISLTVFVTHARKSQDHTRKSQDRTEDLAIANNPPTTKLSSPLFSSVSSLDLKLDSRLLSLNDGPPAALLGNQIFFFFLLLLLMLNIQNHKHQALEILEVSDFSSQFLTNSKWLRALFLEATTTTTPCSDGGGGFGAEQRRCEEGLLRGGFWVEKWRDNGVRREDGFHGRVAEDFILKTTSLCIISLASLIPLEKSLAEPPKPSLSGIIENTKSWSQFYGDGFAIRVPPQFEDLTEPEDYNAGLSLYGDKAKPKTFAARFASSDGYEHTKNSHFALTYEVVSAVIKPSNQLKLTLLEAKDITDFGSLREAAKIFVPGGATIYSARTIKIKEEEGFKTYYFYEFGRDKQHVALVAAVNGGRAYIAGATAPDFKWNDDGVKLRSAAISLTVL
ncbi:hypothetical protein EZV62_006908 [Acer yangbiense]|uniref:PsbP C-terminal domain-containing protein n=1 Tax=Acer yangbiense TaxID=1000413 RepID=A0A5C7I7T6_9ROSI|nr:hypothetical protein EZV62_006908 [Acer yangbiense]